MSDVARVELTLVVTATLLLCGCADEAGRVQGHTGVLTGYVLTAPVCPVERVGQQCPPRPVHGATVAALDRDVAQGSTLTDTEGAFRLALPYGRYVIKATNVGGYASTASEHVVISDNPVQITLIVDSGIR